MRWMAGIQLPGEDTRELGNVDVATGDDAHERPVRHTTGERRRDGCRPRALRHHARALDEQANGIGHGRDRYDERPVEECSRQWPHLVRDALRADAVDEARGEARGRRRAGAYCCVER